MNRWVGKIAVVTGASSGVGAEIAVELVRKGLIVFGVARRLERVEELQSKVSSEKGKLIPYQGDVSIEEDIKNLFATVKKEYGTVHVLVNNAGFMISGYIIEGEPSDWRKVLDVNVLGLATCAKEAVSLMRETGVDDGHIININGTAGHSVPPMPNPLSNIYSPSKFAVTAISETLRRELRFKNTKIRVTNLSPGYTATEFAQVALKNKGDPEAIKKLLAGQPALTPEDLAASVIYILSAPPHVQVHELTLAAI